MKPSPSTNDMEQLDLAHQTTCRLASVHAMFASSMVRRRMLNSLLLRSFVSPCSYIPVIDQFVVSLAHRLSAYEELCSRFGFLGELGSLSPVESESSADNLFIVYKDDQEQCFGNERVQFVAFSNEFLKDADDNIGKEHFLYKLNIDKRVMCSFPNVEIALRMYLILMVTNCSGERSFSKLKYIKNRLRTTMSNERVTHLSLMSIEYDILRETDFDDLITDFAQRKGRKVSGL